MNFLGGDFRFFWPENIRDFATVPSAWDPSLNTGIGKSALGSLWITSYLNFTSFFTNLGLSWNLITILFWIVPAILLSVFSSFLLFRHLFEVKGRRYSFISAVIYTSNTYFLMILTGGQLGVALSYSLVPLVFLRFIKVFENPTLRNSILAGLVLSLQVIFDPRIVYLTLVAILFYFLFNLPKLKVFKSPFFFLSPFIISVLLNAFWILPLFLTKNSPIPPGFDSVSSFKFFSFADFSHSFSLLHPNWPENIFGKVYFLKPEFLMLPILAFSSLLFIPKIKYQKSKIHIKDQKESNSLAIEQFNNKQSLSFLQKNRTVLFFSFLGLLGTFLAKGTNPPFGEVNTWIFSNLPGMSMFRDPTKWYLLIALSYSMLIPYGLHHLSKTFSSKFKSDSTGLKIQKLLSNLFLLFAFCYLLFLTMPLWLGEQREIFKPKEVPKEYVELKDFLVSQKQFFRTLWIPQWQRFGYFSNTHPAIGRNEVFQDDYKQQIKQLRKKEAQDLLKELAVKYIILPYDSESEIFLNDRKHDEIQYKDAVFSLRRIPWLKEVSGFGGIHVFEVGETKDRFWSPSPNIKIEYSFLSPMEYRVKVKNSEKGDLLVFSEGFDKNWIAQNSKSASLEKIQSSEFKSLLNSFTLREGGSQEFKVYYTPQRYVEFGLWISGITFLILAIFLLFGKSLKKW